MKGFLTFILHTHLPFVRHPEYDEFLEESWLYEAITETYIPLIDMLEGMVRDRVPCRLTMSLTPPLLNMLSDSLLQERYVRRLERLIELAEKERVRVKARSDVCSSCRDVRTAVFALAFSLRRTVRVRPRSSFSPFSRARRPGNYRLRRHARLLTAHAGQRKSRARPNSRWGG
jgi:hypothetical protein